MQRRLNMVTPNHHKLRTNPREIAGFLLDELTKKVPPWKPGFEKSFVRSFPHNAATNRSYGGWFNVFVLMLTMRALKTSDGGFLTGLQAEKLGVKINSDAIPNVITYSDGVSRFQKSYCVYSVVQTTGFERMPTPIHLWDPNRRAEDTIKRSGARIIHDRSLDVPHYDFYDDLIIVPNRIRFCDSGSYYRVVLHELAHWTGHSSRLDRELREVTWDTAGRAREELRAEIASYLLGLEFGIGHDLGQNLAYLDYWKRFLVSNIEEIQDAVVAAMKICRFIKKFDRVSKQPKNRKRAQPVAAAL